MQTFTVEDVEIFARGVPHPEGVAFDKAGWLYSGSALPDHKGAGPIYRISPDGQVVEPFADTGGRVLGVAFDRAGDLFACDSRFGAVFRISPGGTVHVFADRVGTRRLQMPNFLVFDQAGQLYVSDSGTATAGEPTGAVFRFSPDGAGEIFLDGLIFANGLALHDCILYVVETRDNRVLRVPILPNGSAGEPSVYVDQLNNGPDGLALDAFGNLYITVTRPSQIVCVTPAGARALLLADLADERMHAPSNLAFGPPGGRGLYIANLFGNHIARLVADYTGHALYSKQRTQA